MLIRIIAWSLEHRMIVAAATVAVAVAGFLSLGALNIDAFPDTTPVQVQVNTDVPGLVATEVERLVTFPIELVMGGLPGLVEVRSISQFGLSQVTVTFEDNSDIYLVRQLIAQRLITVPMPDGVARPELGPIATGLGEVFHYALAPSPDKTPPVEMTQVRTIQDWEIRPELRTVAGTAEVNTWGGLKKQYQVRINPASLFKYDLNFQQVVESLISNNLNVGGGYMDRKGDMLLVHGIARTVGTEQIGNIQMATFDGVPVFLKDVAEIVISHEIRRGMVTADGEGEILLGLGFMRIGENSYAVTENLVKKFHEMQNILPEGVAAERPLRSDRAGQGGDQHGPQQPLRRRAVGRVDPFIFLGNLRAGLIAAAGIPLCMLFAFSGMYQIGIAGTLLSLGAIDFGIVVDSSVVVIENIVRRLAHHGAPLDAKSRLGIIREAVVEVRKPAVFGQLIIMIVYIPILTLEGVEGKMFRPMALTVILVLIGSLIVSMTLTPVLASVVLPRRLASATCCWCAWRNEFTRRCCAALSAEKPWSARWPRPACWWRRLVAGNLGTEFVPQLAEGSLVVGLRYPPGTSYEESGAITRSSSGSCRRVPRRGLAHLEPCRGARHQYRRRHT